MSLEDKLEANTAALKANTEALLAVLAASGNAAAAAAPAPDAAPAKSVKRKAAAAAAPAPEPEPTAAVPGTKVEAPAPAPASAKPPGDDREEHPEFDDPLDAPQQPVDPQALIADISSSWKALQLGATTDARKQFLVTTFQQLRSKWGLGENDKLAALIPTPEKLAGLLADIKALPAA